jgi:hypothetical protein
MPTQEDEARRYMTSTSSLRIEDISTDYGELALSYLDSGSVALSCRHVQRTNFFLTVWLNSSAQSSRSANVVRA